MARNFKRDVDDVTGQADFKEQLDIRRYSEGKQDYQDFVSGIFQYTFAVYRIKGAGVKYADTMRLMPDSFYRDLLNSIEVVKAA